MEEPELTMVSVDPSDLFVGIEDAGVDPAISVVTSNETVQYPDEVGYTIEEVETEPFSIRIKRFLRHLLLGVPDELAERKKPKLIVQLIFILLLGTASTLMAEVSAVSWPLFYIHPLTYILVIPVYFSHIVVLGTLILRYGRTFDIFTLFAAGVIFGMYEGPLTKILWDSTWDFIVDIHFLGMEWTQTIILIFYWHPVYAFILPLFTVEAVLTGSREFERPYPRWLRSLLEWRWSRYGIVIFTVSFSALHAGGFSGLQGPYVLPAVLSLNAVIGTSILIFLWTAIVLFFGRRRWSMVDLLPGPIIFYGCVIVLFLVYLGHFFISRFDAFPSWDGLITYSVMYVFFVAVFLALLHRGYMKHRKRIRDIEDEMTEQGEEQMESNHSSSNYDGMIEMLNEPEQELGLSSLDFVPVVQAELGTEKEIMKDFRQIILDRDTPVYKKTKHWPLLVIAAVLYIVIVNVGGLPGLFLIGVIFGALEMSIFPLFGMVFYAICTIIAVVHVVKTIWRFGRSKLRKRNETVYEVTVEV